MKKLFCLLLFALASCAKESDVEQVNLKIADLQKQDSIFKTQLAIERQERHEMDSAMGYYIAFHDSIIEKSLSKIEKSKRRGAFWGSFGRALIGK
jgi:hypothetical protein